MQVFYYICAIFLIQDSSRGFFSALFIMSPLFYAVGVSAQGLTSERGRGLSYFLDSSSLIYRSICGRRIGKSF